MPFAAVAWQWQAPHLGARVPGWLWDGALPLQGSSFAICRQEEGTSSPSNTVAESQSWSDLEGQT